jgi:shikimate kinase
MKSGIALIGFMGVGKTAVGQALAARLRKEFIELDAVIESQAGKRIPEIFRQDGEIGFRELEIAAVKAVADKKDAVIACGGGVILNTINIDRLRKDCIIIYLTATPEVILNRTSADKTQRPLLMGSDKIEKIEKLLKFRRPFYERAADYKVDTSKMDIDSVVEKILKKLKDK